MGRITCTHVSRLAAVAAGLLMTATAARPVCAEAPKRVFEGAGTSAAVERATGRVAVAREGRLEIFDRVDAARPAATLDLPNASARVVEFRGGVVAFSFTLTKEPGLHLMAMDTSGRERLVWPNDGIGTTFPTETSRLTLDGAGLFDMLTLNPTVRAELDVPADVADGAGVVVTYRFSTERMLIRFAPAFHSAAALTCGDLVIAWHDGTVIRYASPGGIVWKKDFAAEPEAVVADVDAKAGTVLCLGPKGGLVALDLADGAVRWKREPTGPGTVRDARLLGDGRALVLGADTTLGLFNPATGALTSADVLAGLGPVVSAWKEHASDLRSVFEVVAGTRPALLLAGADGWYLFPLP